MKKWLLALAFSLGFSVAVQAADSSAPDLISDTSTQVLEILKKDTGKNTAAIRTQVEALVIPRFDFQRMTALAVGVNWRQATPAQQQALAAQFQTLLVKTYSSTMTRFKSAQIDVNPKEVLNSDGKISTVKSDITLPNSTDKKTISVEYTLYKTANTWKVYDVKVEGASLVTVYRNQFTEEVSKSGINGLIKSLEQKNTKPAS